MCQDTKVPTKAAFSKKGLLPHQDPFPGEALITLSLYYKLCPFLGNEVEEIPALGVNIQR